MYVCGSGSAVCGSGCAALDDDSLCLVNNSIILVVYESIMLILTKVYENLPCLMRAENMPCCAGCALRTCRVVQNAR